MRLAGQAKMGYYPTPDVVAQRIGRALTRAGAGVIRTLDPCCGAGTALVLATQDLGEPVERYGIELNQERAAAAKETLTRVLRADLRSTRIANGAFGLVYLNPPYDFSVRTHLDEAAERLELHFLQASLRYLQPQGILVYLIPERRLDSRIASLLAYHLEAIQVFRFPGDSYEPFKQIVLFGVRKATPYRDEEVQQHLQAIGRLAAAPPELPENFPAPYGVPVSPPSPQPPLPEPRCGAGGPHPGDRDPWAHRLPDGPAPSPHHRSQAPAPHAPPSGASRFGACLGPPQ